MGKWIERIAVVAALVLIATPALAQFQTAAGIGGVPKITSGVWAVVGWVQAIMAAVGILMCMFVAFKVWFHGEAMEQYKKLLHFGILGFGAPALIFAFQTLFA